MRGCSGSRGLYYFTETVDRTESFLTQFSLLPAAGGDVTFVQDVDSESYAAFGQITYPFTDRFSMTLGLRYTEDEKDARQIGRNNDPNDATPGIPLFPGQPYDVTASDSWESTTGRFGVDYRTESGQLLYASASKGFKSGIFPSQNNVVQNVGVATPEEEVWSYEIGAKTEWFDRTLRVNLALFHMDYEDLQLFRLDPQLQALDVHRGHGEPGRRARDPGRAGRRPRSRPERGLSQGRGGRRTERRRRVAARSGTHARRVRRVFVAGRRAAGCRSAASSSGRTTTGPRSLTTTTPRTGASRRSRAYALLDARAAYQLEGRNLEFSVWGKNLTDEEYPLHTIPFLGNGFSIFAPPRTYGVSVAWKSR